MVWTVHWRAEGDPKLKLDVAVSREDALRIAKQKQDLRGIRISKISGPNGEILTAEQVLPLIKNL